MIISEHVKVFIVSRMQDFLHLNTCRNCYITNDIWSFIWRKYFSLWQCTVQKGGWEQSYSIGFETVLFLYINTGLAEGGGALCNNGLKYFCMASSILLPLYILTLLYSYTPTFLSYYTLTLLHSYAQKLLYWLL